MPTIQPIDLQQPGAAEQIINTVRANLGGVPNIFATMAHSPAALEGFLGLSSALQKGVLPPAVGEQIALAIAGQNQCDYCASAHTVMAKGAGVDEGEISRNLQGSASDEKTNQMIAFALAVVADRGQVSPEQVDALRRVGVTDQELIELIAHVGLNIFTNYFNHVVGTDIDFPHVTTSAG